MGAIDTEVATCQAAYQERQDAIAVAADRLGLRSTRPARELVQDPAQRALANELAELKNLRNVKLSYNQFETIPPVLTKLKRLTSLNMGGCLLRDVDDVVGDLSSRFLRDLNLEVVAPMDGRRLEVSADGLPPFHAATPRAHARAPAAHSPANVWPVASRYVPAPCMRCRWKVPSISAPAAVRRLPRPSRRLSR